MKGIIFTEFLESVEARYGFGMVDLLIEGVKPISGGAYTSVGTYDSKEFMELVAELSRRTSMPVKTVYHDYGRLLFRRFTELYPNFFEGVETAPDFLSTIENRIHAEVRKLNPDAELPKFDYLEPKPGNVELIYTSQRPLADLAEGLLLGCISHFGRPFEITREDLPADQGMTLVRFTMTALEKAS